jgi:glycosyltransferase involved in cell wall biosynthesis
MATILSGFSEMQSLSPKLPRISIITPSYNQAQFIEQTINSVLDQYYPDLEYIVMDGGSTDGTLDILHKYDGRLTWFSEIDRGQSDAINKGLVKATGDVIAFLNSDDLYEPGALLAVGNYFARHPEVSWLTGWCRTVDSRGKEIRKISTFYKQFWLLLRSYTALLVLDYISQPATFWRREVLEKVGNFDETLQFAMDYDYSLRVGRHYKLFVLPRYLARFRVHPASKAGATAHNQFDADLKIACSHTDSVILRWLHARHNRLIVNIYRGLYSSQ